LLLLGLIRAGLMHDDARGKHPGECLVLIQHVCHEACGLYVREIWLAVPALIMRHKRALQREGFDFVGESLRYAGIDDGVAPEPWHSPQRRPSPCARVGQEDGLSNFRAAASDDWSGASASVLSNVLVPG